MSRPTFEVADLIHAQGAGFVDQHRQHLSYQQLKVLRAIAQCRTAALGGHVDDCPRCSHQAISYNGSVATRSKRKDRPLRFDEGLVETEEGAKHPGLSAQVGSGNPEYLSFANHLHGLNPRNHSARGRHCPRPLHGA